MGSLNAIKPIGAHRCELMGAVYGWKCPDLLIEGERRDIFRKNEYLQQVEGVKKTDGTRWALSIPAWDYELFKRINPALTSKDAKTRTNAMLSFLNHPASKPYRVGA